MTMKGSSEYDRAGTLSSRSLLLLALLTTSTVGSVWGQDAAAIAESDLDAFHPRSIGPAVTGGRVHDLEALPDDPSTLYVATASGGLWKTTNRGHTWKEVFGHHGVSTFGDVAIAPSSPDVLYAGTGEQNNRQSTSWGNGVYRSDDAGATWRHLGLGETRHIGKIEVSPRDPDVVFVAALGNLWKGTEARGVYRSRDGGRSWEKVLYVDEYTGAVDLVMNPDDPEVLYAATYQRLRRTWGFNGGGPGSGIWKTTDGGDSWTELTDPELENGLPTGDKGRIGLALAHSQPDVVMALIEHENEEGTYRSEDAGRTWTKVNDLDPRPMYYSEIFVDPTTPDRVYVLGTSSYKSEDGGRSFDLIAERPTYDVGVHADHHALWIDPGNPNHLYLAGDAGLHESYDRGESFRRINNFAIGQFYAIGVDMRDPYWIYGGMQDNHSWMGPSRTRHWAGILNGDWSQIGFGDGMYAQPDPTSARYVYSNAQNGEYTRVDGLTGDVLDIAPEPPEGEESRFDWVSPSLISPHDPWTVYVGGNRLFISRNRGRSWERTEDLTRAQDRDTLELMGVPGSEITLSPNDGTESYGEITTIDESPLDPRILWVGTDDGNVQVSRDGGESWTEVGRNVPGVGSGTYVSRVTASASDPGVAYAAFDAHRDGDFAPYLFRTRDFGRSWQALHGRLPSGSVNEIIEHPDNPDVLFLGTEHALFVSTDAGADWARMPNLPTTLYDDLVIHPREKDLVIGTHGRSIWILDDTRPLAEWSRPVTAAPAHLFTVRPATIFQYWKDTSYRAEAAFAGRNPAEGALLTYRLGRGSGEAVLRILDSRGRVVRRLRVPAEPGLHRVNWDLRHPFPGDSGVWRPFDAEALAHAVEDRGPFVSPGTYTVALDARGTTVTRTVEVRPDPEMPVTAAGYQLRERFLLDLLDLLRSSEALAQELEGADEGFPAHDVSDDVRELQRSVRRLYGAINGDGVQQGTLYPPTETQREEARRLRDELERLRTRVES